MRDGLAAVLRRARDLGFLGPGDPDVHVHHALAFADAYEALEGGPPAACCDLGAGGGVPGLVLATRWPRTHVILLEASVRRCAFLRDAVGELGVVAAGVSEGRAEDLARTPLLEGQFELVTARSFGRPATTAECAVRLLSPGGLLMVAEPPTGEVGVARWPRAGLATLGLEPAAVANLEPRLVAIRRGGPCPDLYPRRNGVPAKRPLF